jgi:hypothetical protein
LHVNCDRPEDNRRLHERRVCQRRGADGGFSLACDSSVLWRSSAEILGFRVQAADGALGRVEDFCVEEESSVITAMVVCGRGRLFVVPLDAIARVDWSTRRVYLRPARAQIRRWSGATAAVAGHPHAPPE